MKVLTFLSLLALLLVVVPWTRADSYQRERIVFIGKVLRVSPDTGDVSGNIAVYRLVKYKVERICEGYYQAKEIVVDHLILTGKELEGVKIGDRFCLAVSKSEQVPNRYNAKGIREPSDLVSVFYVGRGVSTSLAGCPCK